MKRLVAERNDGQQGRDHDWNRRAGEDPSASHGIIAMEELVAVGTEGAVVGSGEWAGLGATLINDRRALAECNWGKDCFARVGYSEAIVVCKDGVHWSPSQSGTNERLQRSPGAKPFNRSSYLKNGRGLGQATLQQPGAESEWGGCAASAWRGQGLTVPS